MPVCTCCVAYGRYLHTLLLGKLCYCGDVAQNRLGIAATAFGGSCQNINCFLKTHLNRVICPLFTCSMPRFASVPSPHVPCSPILCHQHQMHAEAALCPSNVQRLASRTYDFVDKTLIVCCCSLILQYNRSAYQFEPTRSNTARTRQVRDQ